MGDPIVAERGSALYQTIASECDMITGRNVADKEQKKIFSPEIGKVKITEQFSTLHQRVKAKTTPRRQERQNTNINTNTQIVVLHTRYECLYISQTYSAKQQGKINSVDVSVDDNADSQQ